jgi:hypothetical protein
MTLATFALGHTIWRFKWYATPEDLRLVVLVFKKHDNKGLKLHREHLFRYIKDLSGRGLVSKPL